MSPATQTTETQTRARPVASINSDDVTAALWENTNGKTGRSFYRLSIDGVDADITFNANKFKEDGDQKPDLYGKRAVVWRGTSPKAGVPQMTVKITDEELVEAVGQEYITLFVNDASEGDAPADDE